MEEKKCICGAKNKTSCPNCSKYKMCILLKTGFNHLKLPLKNGNRKVNPVWYNYLSKNLKNQNTVLNGMYKRVLNSKYVGAINKLNFYDNTTGKLITTIDLR